MLKIMNITHTPTAQENAVNGTKKLHYSHVCLLSWTIAIKLSVASHHLKCLLFDASPAAAVTDYTDKIIGDIFAYIFYYQPWDLCLQ